MTIGLTPIRERLVLPRRSGVPLAHVFSGEESFPGGTAVSLHLYDREDVEVAFWPLTVAGADATLDVASEEWWPYRDAARSFAVFVVYAAEPTRRWAWYAGHCVRSL